MRVSNGFHRFAHRVSEMAGSFWAFILSLSVIVVWAVTGPFFHYSDTWQLIINTGTTVITFLMVFLIQHTQNRDARAVHLKLDELIRAVSGARNSMVETEHLTDEQLDSLQEEFQELARHVERRKAERHEKRAGGEKKPREA